MSATQNYHYLFGSTWPNENYIITFNQAQQQFVKLPVDQVEKINNWSSAIHLQNDEFLVTGGLGASGKIISNEAFIFNASTLEITNLPTFHQCRYVHQSVQHNGKIYVLGGRQYGPDFESVLAHCEKYEDGQWKIISSMSKRRSNFNTFIYHDQIHVIGGFDGKKNTRSIEYYDENKNIWRRLKVKLTRGLAGFHLVPKDDNKIMIIGGMTQQGPSLACHLLDLENNTVIAASSTTQVRSLAHMFNDGTTQVLYGGMQKPNTFEAYNNTTHMWEESPTVTVQQELVDLFNTGLRGFTSSQYTCQVGSGYGQIEQQEEKTWDPQDVAFMFGNDEYPFILPICKSYDSQNLEPISIPTKLSLYSYMSVCSVDAELPNCRQIFIAGGIDARVSQINKKAQLVTIIFPEMKIRVKNIDKLAYHRYAAACVFQAPFVYVIGGRGYQNDLLSLHNTVERFNVDEEEWDQIAPMNEAKCSLTACVLNDQIYVFGGYIGEGQISHKIECYNEQHQTWNVLSVELPFALEGLSCVTIDDASVLIIGGKGIEGSKKEIIKYNLDELENNTNTSGQSVGQLKHSRSLPKPLLMQNGSILIFGGQFFDNPETNFAEIINLDNLEDIDESYLDDIELATLLMGGEQQLNMFSLTQ